MGRAGLKLDKVFLRSFSLSLLGAVVLFLAFSLWINDFTAMQLRVISTTVSQVLLSVLGYDVIRQGTSLLIDGFLFNVDVACSGSQTLQMMFSGAIVLTGLSSMLLLEKISSLLFAVVIAVVINGMRVAALILSSLYTGSGLTEETFLHQAIGVVAYVAALLLFLEACKLISGIKVLHADPFWLKVVIAILLLLLLFLPFVYENIISWAGSEWNPYNRYGFVFVLIAVAAFGYYSLAEVKNSLNDSCMSKLDLFGYIVLLAGGCFWGVITGRIGFVSAQAAGVLLILSAMLVRVYSFRYLIFELPLLGVLALGFVRVPLMLSNFSGLRSWGSLFLLRLFLAFLFIILYVFLRRFSRSASLEFSRKEKAESKDAAVLTISYVILLFSLAVSMLWQGRVGGGVANTVAEADIVKKEELFLDFPEQLGVWQSREVVLQESTQELLGGSAAELLVYESDYALPVEVLYNLSMGDRHNLHPPEYCLTGAGWVITDQEISKITGKDGVQYPITVMELSNNLEKRWFAFWFYDGRSIRKNYIYMLGYDLLARLGGDRKEWSVYRIIAQREEDLYEFLRQLSTDMQQKNNR